MPRRILIAPDKFKGSLTALEAAQAMAEGVRDIEPDAEIDLCPIADGGEGFMEALQPALDGRWVDTPAVDARGRPISSRYLLADTEDGPVAVIAMAATAGIARLAGNERNPLTATTPPSFSMPARHTHKKRKKPAPRQRLNTSRGK